MSYSPLAIKRSRVLGDIYKQCETVAERVPVYMNDAAGELLGYADESLGHYADAFVFHLSEDVCKKLSAGHFTYSFNYEHSPNEEKVTGRRRIKLNAILLNARKGYAKPVPKTKNTAAAVIAAADAAAAEVAVSEPTEVQA